MHKNNALTIDWDYFVPEKLEWDFGHQENNLFINKVWEMRANMNIDITKEMKTTGEENTFIDYLKSKFIINPNTELIVTESHLDMYYLLTNEYKIDTVYNYDAHCDLGYSGIKNLSESEYIDCGNWLGLALLNDYVSKANIIYSFKTNENSKDFNDISKVVNADFINKNFKIEEKIPLSFIHICRSGSWTPPFLDDELFNFVNKLKSEFSLNLELNIMKREWDQDKFNAIRKQFLEFYKDLKKDV